MPLTPSGLPPKYYSIVTLFYGILDAERRLLAYCDAGHPPPILVRASGSAIPRNAKGAVLGVFPEWRYEDSVIHFSPGDTLVLFTDGITEAATSGDEEFGEQRLISAVSRRDGLSAPELQGRVLAEVNAFCNSQLRDDATLLVISAVKASAEPARAVTA